MFDGETLTPYIVSTSARARWAPCPRYSTRLLHLALANAVSTSIHSRGTLLNEASIVEFLATGVVILISIAIAAGIVFLLALAGILWTLFARKDDKLHTFAAGDDDDDDDSAHHRPSSLLEHINAATRTTILGGAVGAGAFGAYNAEKEEEHSAASASGGPEVQADPFGPDASNYMRAETPSDAVGGLLGGGNEPAGACAVLFRWHGRGRAADIVRRRGGGAGRQRSCVRLFSPL